MELKNEEFIGISDGRLCFSLASDDKIEKKDHVSMHMLFSIYKERLIIRCLDFSISEYINLSEFVQSKKDKDVGDIANMLIVESIKKTIGTVIDSIAINVKKNSEHLSIHSDNKYWNSYREIRSQRENYKLKNFFGIGDSSTEFLDLDKQIKSYVEKMLLDMYKTSDVERVSTRSGDFTASVSRELITQIEKYKQAA